MAVDLQIKYGDERDWSFTLSEPQPFADVHAVTGATVSFKLRKEEGDSGAFFERTTGSGGTGSDFISLSATPTDGTVTIIPTPSDWSEISDYGVYCGEFLVVDSNSKNQYTKDILIDVQRAIV